LNSVEQRLRHNVGFFAMTAQRRGFRLSWAGA